jgi:hypothetical protein
MVWGVFADTNRQRPHVGDGTICTNANPTAVLRLSHLMEKIDTTTKTLMPVFNTTGCVGHLLRTACDANDQEIGVFETPAVGIAALLEAATDAASNCYHFRYRTWWHQPVSGGTAGRPVCAARQLLRFWGELASP